MSEYYILAVLTSSLGLVFGTAACTEDESGGTFDATSDVTELEAIEDVDTAEVFDTGSTTDVGEAGGRDGSDWRTPLAYLAVGRVSNRRKRPRGPGRRVPFRE